MKTFAVPLLVLATAVAGCSKPASRPPVSAESRTVSSAEVLAVTASRQQPVFGTVRPVDRATLAARVPGRIIQVHPPLGARVRAGDVVVTMEAGELAARLKQARADLASLERELTRESTLVGKGASSAESARTLEDRRQAALAAVEEAATLWSYTTVQAPFDGVITVRHREPGDLAVAGTPLLDLEGVDRLRAEVQVPESLALPALGSPMEIERAGTRLTATLTELSPAADPVTRTRLAKLTLPPGDATPSGQFVRVLWPAGERRSLTVPASAVTRFGHMEQVWIITEGRARLRLVRTGERIADRIELLSGADEGERVILQPPAGLRDGDPVNARS
jgi:RND family efflux transporter MFP subunit